jgi:hypothetical protein
LTSARRAVILFPVMACIFTIQRGNPCVLPDVATVVAMEKIR